MNRSDLVRGMLRVQQSVGLTPSEFRATLLLAGLLFTGIVARNWIDQPPDFDASTYQALHASFSARAAELAAADTNEVRRRDSLATAGVDTSNIAGPDDPVESPKNVTRAVPGRPIDINTAGADALITLPRIGPALAGRIIAFRAEHGPFRFVEDLLMVRGIGEKTLEGFRALVTVGHPPEPDAAVRADSASGSY